jgi:hypothetical protein
MPKLVASCPSCSTELHATRLACTACDVVLEGSFELPALLHLPPADLAFVMAFVRSSGSLKAMAQQLEASYPTVRARLDEIITRLDALDQGAERKRHEILDALERGKLTAKEAALRLKKVGA